MPIRSIILVVIILLAANLSCKIKSKENHLETISNPNMQSALYKRLMKINPGISELNAKGSLSILVFPVAATCPSCRKKTVDSIVQYQNKLDMKHVVVISGRDYEEINSTFLKLGQQVPLNRHNIVIDSFDYAFKGELIFNSPKIFYVNNHRVVKQVICMPDNIKGELIKFFTL